MTEAGTTTSQMAIALWSDLLALIHGRADNPEWCLQGPALIYDTIRSERVRGEESMRERAETICTDHMEGRYHLSDLATHVGDKQGAAVHYAAGNALGEARAAIKALPTTDKEPAHG